MTINDDGNDVVVDDVVRDDVDERMEHLLGLSMRLVKCACRNVCPMYPTIAVKTLYPCQLV